MRPQRELIEPFIVLPSKRSFPIYYEWAKTEKRTPIDLRACFTKVPMRVVGRVVAAAADRCGSHVRSGRQLGVCFVCGLPARSGHDA